jgi:hypothetical protein
MNGSNQAAASEAGKLLGYSVKSQQGIHRNVCKLEHGKNPWGQQRRTTVVISHVF